MQQSASEIQEQILEATGQALMDNDPDAFAKWFSLPHQIETFDGRRIIRTREELFQVFRAVKAHYDKIGVTQIVRRCVEASFNNPDTIVAMFETRLICGTIIARRPFPTLAVTRLTSDGWKVVSNSYAIDGYADHNAALLCAGETEPGRGPAGKGA